MGLVPHFQKVFVLLTVAQGKNWLRICSYLFLESHSTDFYLKGRRRKTGRESDDLWGRRRRRLCSIWEEVDYKVSYPWVISLPLVALEKGLTKSLGFSDFTQAVDWRTQCLPLAQVSPRMDRPGEAFNRSQPVQGSTHSRTCVEYHTCPEYWPR